MMTDEEAQELQAANAAMFAMLLRVEWPRKHPSEWGRCPICHACAPVGHAVGCDLEAMIEAGVGRPRLALERATVQALRERVADVAHVEPGVACTCARCERDRELLAQWAALGVEGTP